MVVPQNPFQSGIDGSPVSSISSVQSNKSYDISSPRTASVVGDPFMGVAISQNSNVGYRDVSRLY